MRFAAAAVVFAGAVMAGESTVFSTDYITVTSCAPEVTNCPAKSTSVKTSVYPVTTSTIYATTTRTVTSCAATVTNCPAESVVVVTDTIAISTTVCPVTATETHASYTKTYGNGTTTAKTTLAPVSSSVKASSIALPTTSSVCVPTYSVKTITSSVTTVVPTVIYETVSLPCTTAKPSSGFTSPASNGTATTTAKPSVITAGASTMGGSLALVAAAGVLALAL